MRTPTSSRCRAAIGNRSASTPSTTSAAAGKLTWPSCVICAHAWEASAPAGQNRLASTLFVELQIRRLHHVDVGRDVLVDNTAELVRRIAARRDGHAFELGRDLGVANGTREGRLQLLGDRGCR